MACFRSCSPRHSAGYLAFGFALGLVATPAAAAPPQPAKRILALPTGITLAYREAGAAGGTPVLFLHGYTDTSRSFLPTMERLAKLRPDLRLIATDQRGHGDSSLPAAPGCPSAPESCFRMVDLAADALALLDALGLERAYLVGHSMGSLVAQEIALSHPERVLGVVLLASATTMVDNPVARDYLRDERIEGAWRQAMAARGLRWPEDVYRLTPLDVGPEAHAWMVENWVTEPLAEPALLGAIALETARVPLGTWLGALRVQLATDHGRRLESLTVPTLVLWATQDVIFPETPWEVALRAALGKAAAGCRAPMYWKRYGRKSLPDSGIPEGELGHNFHWAAPGEVARDLAAFLRPGGAPTAELYYGDPNLPQRVATAENAAAVTQLSPEACSD